MGDVVPMERPEDAAVRSARESAKDTGRLIWTRHIREQMAAREISTEQVLTCLEKGKITEGPAPDLYGGWKFNLLCRSAGDEIEVVVAVNLETKVILITAI